MRGCIGSIILVLLTLAGHTFSVENKYTKEANVKYRELEKPFRMAKVNLIWQKAIHKLTETKLRSLYSDLQLHDKEEIQLKRLKSEAGDKDGLKEAEVRRKFKGILNAYGLIDFFEPGAPKTEPQDFGSHRKENNHINKSLFKDKKLNKLWEKAEKGGFTEQELKALKEEFFHHQDRVDEYYALLESTGKRDKNDLDNEVYREEFGNLDAVDPQEKKVNASMNELRGKHREIKDGYDHLLKKATSGPLSTEFNEPKVQALWKLANTADFNHEELASLQMELKHYEKRLEKLHVLESDLLLKNDVNKHANQDKDISSFYEEKIKRHQRQVEKLHTELEGKIVSRHTEL